MILIIHKLLRMPQYAKGGGTMETQKTYTFSLWKKRHTLPTIRKRTSIVLLFIIIAAAFLLPGGAFGTFYLTVAGALLALLLTADRSPLWLLSIPGVGGMAYLTYALFAVDGTSIFWILAAFLYIPIGFALAACIYSGKNLTITTAVLSVIFGVVLLSIAAVQVWIQYGDLREGFAALWEQFQNGLTDMLSSIGLPGENGVIYVYTEREVQALVQSATMLLPAMGVLACQLFAYLTAKIYRLLALALNANYLFPKGKWPVTASVPAYIVFVVSYFFTIFSSETSIASYAAINLLYIFLPVTSVAGFHAMFSTSGRLSSRGRRGSRIILIVLCVIIFNLSPVALFILMAFFGAIRTFSTALRSWLKKRSGPDT